MNYPVSTSHATTATHLPGEVVNFNAGNVAQPHAANNVVLQQPPSMYLNYNFQ